MTEETEIEYPDDLVAFLETVWGEGYLSPGGAEEVDRVLVGISIAGKSVLDIGCGSGGVTMHLADAHGAGPIIGVDVEDPVLETAKARLATRTDGAQEKISFKKVSPGPLPFDNESFDIVFSKDALIHIADKEALFAEVFRVLKPGGWCLASDWLRADENEPSRDMKDYIAMEGLSFGMASPDRYRASLERAGFENITLSNRNEWYAQVAKDELAQLKGNLYLPAIEAAGKPLVDHHIGTWVAMLKVLQTGEHCPHHFRGQKPETA
ncbi:MAG: class I SAM-dependent methyltransferase [Hyphomicrobiales bacterium]